MTILHDEEVEQIILASLTRLKICVFDIFLYETPHKLEVGDDTCDLKSLEKILLESFVCARCIS